MSNQAGQSRREFVRAGIAGAVALTGAPQVVTASRTSDEVIIGDGEYRFRVNHTWPNGWAAAELRGLFPSKDSGSYLLLR